MKKIILLTAIAILLTALTSCDPEPIPGPPPVNYAISTNTIGKGLVTPDKLSGVNLGSDVTFKITPEAGYSIYSIKINGILAEGFQPSSSETSYTVKDVKTNLYIEFTFVETDILIFSVKSTNEEPWMWTKLKIYKVSDNSLIYDVELTSSEKADKYYYVYPSMEALLYKADGSVRSGTWDLKQRVLTLGSGSPPCEVVELTKSKIVIKFLPVWSNADNCYVYAQYTYERK